MKYREYNRPKSYLFRYPRMTPLRILPAVSLLSTLALAACGGPAATGSGPSVSADGSASVTEEREGPATQAALLPPGPVTEPARLKGLKALQVRAVLGQPVFKRRDTPAEIWQYRSPACTLDVFLYEEKGGQVVAHYAVRSTSGLGDKDCFDQLVARSRGIPTG